MKEAQFNSRSIGFIFLFFLGIALMPLTSLAQEEVQDTVEAIQDNSSAFNDSVQFDDMEPIFYEATEEETEPAAESGSGIALYAGIALVLLVILIVLKKLGKKKKA